MLGSRLPVCERTATLFRDRGTAPLPALGQAKPVGICQENEDDLFVLAAPCVLVSLADEALAIRARVAAQDRSRALTRSFTSGDRIS